MRAAIYPRLSKDRTGTSPNVTIQQLECEEYAAEQGWEVAGVFPDNDISASRYSTKPRPGYQELLHAIRANRVDVVLCTEVSRLYRRIDELIDLIKLADRTRLQRIETTDGFGYDLSTGEGIHNAISAVNNAQLESRKISDRSKRKKKVMARSGLFGGGQRPFGYDYIPAVRNNQGQVLDPGRLILKRLLLSKTLIGVREHRTIDPQTHQPVTMAYPGTWPPILDEVTHERLAVVLNDETKLLGMDTRQPRSYLLTGMIFCGVCGHSLVGSGSGKAGHYERGYICRKMTLTGEVVACGTVSRRAAPVEEFIRQAVLTTLDSSATLKAIEVSENDDDFSQALVRYTELKDQLDRLAGLLVRGVFDERTYLIQRDELQGDLDTLRAHLDRSGTTRPLAQVEVGQTLSEAWDSQDLDWRRSLVSLVISKVVIKPGRAGGHKWESGRGTWRFRPELVEITWRA
jgi:site-specific DNA recombinase